VIVAGLAEVDPETGLYYSTAVVVGPDGYIGKYRKVHQFAGDAKWSLEGDLGFPVFETPAGRIGVEICMDAIYPESGRLLALAGAQIICFPTNWVGHGGHPSQRWITQAFENGVYLIAADRWGEERGVQFQGGSCIVAPDGAIEAAATTGNAIIYGTIDLARTEARSFAPGTTEDKLADRRPDLYREMLQNTYGFVPAYYHRLFDRPGLPEPRRSEVGVLQFTPEAGNADANLRRIRQLTEGRNLDLLVLPALALTGTPDAASGDLDVLTELSGHLSALVVTTIAETTDNGTYHTAVLVGPNGPIGRHRQWHLTAEERTWAIPGNEPPRTLDTPLGRIGLLAGYDSLFFESTRVLATLGADLICIPAALRWPLPQPIGDGTEWVFWRSKAWESYVALAVANRPGPEYAGGSQIFIPALKEADDIEERASRNEETLLCVPFDSSSRYIREKRGMGWRRLHWYTPLVS
jgi:predicted amidohydrolase